MRDEEWFDETGELQLVVEHACDECGEWEDEDGRCPSCGKPL